VRSLTPSSIPTAGITCKCTSMILERDFDVFCFIREKACSHVHVLPNTLAKFRKSENADTDKEA
jgi:hypothetical protein